MKNKLMMLVKIIFIVSLIYYAAKNDILAIFTCLFLSNVYVTRKYLLQCSDMPQLKDKVYYLLWVLSVFVLWNAIIITNWRFITTHYTNFTIETITTSFIYFGNIIYSCVAYKTGWSLSLFRSGSRLSFQYGQEASEMQLHFSGNKKNFYSAFCSLQKLLRYSLTNPRLKVIILTSPLLAKEKFRSKLERDVELTNKISSSKKQITIVDAGDYEPRIHERLGYWLTFTLKNLKRSKEYWQNSKSNWPMLKLTIIDK
jgi:hypothetical protein